MDMVTHNLDGINYDAAPEIVNALKKQDKRADDAENSLKTINTEHSKLKADFDSQKEKLVAAEKIYHSEAIQKK